MVTPDGHDRADEFAVAVDPPSDVEPSRERGGRRRATPTPWVAAAVALVLVGSATATPLPAHVHGRGDGDAVGLTELDLSSPPVVEWLAEVENGSVSWIGDERVVLSSASPDDGRVLAVSVVDLTSGAVVWTRDDQVEACLPGDVVTCTEQPRSAATELVAISTVDGDTARVSAPYAWSGVMLDDGWLVAESTGEDDLDLVLRDRDGHERWRRTLDDQPDLTSVAIDVRDDVATIWLMSVSPDGGESTQLAVDLADGEPFVPDEAGSDPIQDIWVWENEGTISVVQVDPRWYRTELLAFDDDDGGPVVLEPSEGWSGTNLVATLAATGEELWRVSGCFPQGRLRGAVVATCYEDGSTVGIDELTGAELWRRDGYAEVLLASHDLLALRGDGGTLDAIDPGTGTSAWSIPFPTGPDGPVLIGDRILSPSATDVTMLRWES